MFYVGITRRFSLKSDFALANNGDHDRLLRYATFHLGLNWLWGFWSETEKDQQARKPCLFYFILPGSVLWRERHLIKVVDMHLISTSCSEDLMIPEVRVPMG